MWSERGHRLTAPSRGSFWREDLAGFAAPTPLWLDRGPARGVTPGGPRLKARLAGPSARPIDGFCARHEIELPGEACGANGRFGRPQPHILSHLRHPEFPEILPLSNVLEDGEPIGVYDGAAYWHTDMSYEAEPGATTLVYSIQTPASESLTRM